MAVVCEIDGLLRGAVNARLLEAFPLLEKPVPVSPKKLGAEEKTERWGSLWGHMTLQEGAGGYDDA